jgi:hypothetical protein
LFAEVAKAPWNKGKQPNRERNQKLLEMYDNAVAWDRTRLCSGAPRSIKMGTTRSPCPYDAAARHALQSARLRCTAILHYASRGRLPDFAGWSGYPPIAAMPINPGIDAMCHNPT